MPGIQNALEFLQEVQFLGAVPTITSDCFNHPLAGGSSRAASGVCQNYEAGHENLPDMANLKLIQQINLPVKYVIRPFSLSVGMWHYVFATFNSRHASFTMWVCKMLLFYCLLGNRMKNCWFFCRFRHAWAYPSQKYQGWLIWQQNCIKLVRSCIFLGDVFKRLELIAIFRPGLTVCKVIFYSCKCQNHVHWTQQVIKICIPFLQFWCLWITHLV